MHSIKNRGVRKDESYVSSMSSVDVGSISVISSSNSQRYSDLATNDPLANNDIGQFDIIDDLDYDDIDDGLIGIYLFIVCYLSFNINKF